MYCLSGTSLCRFSLQINLPIVLADKRKVSNLCNLLEKEHGYLEKADNCKKKKHCRKVASER